MSGPIGINYMPPDAPTASAGSVSVATQPSSALHNAELAAGAYVQALQGSPPQGFSLQIGRYEAGCGLTAGRQGADCRGALISTILQASLVTGRAVELCSQGEVAGC